MPKAVQHHLIRLNSNCLLANSIKPSSAWSLSIFHLRRKFTQPFQFHYVMTYHVGVSVKVAY